MLWRPITSYYKKTLAGNHEIRWRDDHGKESQKTFKTKLEAIGWQEYLRTGEAPEYLPNKPANSISLHEFVEIFRVRHCALKAYGTAKLYMRDLELWVLPYLGNKIMAKIDDDDIHTWMERLVEEKKPSPKSLANYRKTLHKVFKCAMTWKFEDRYGNRVAYVAKNPVATTKCLLPPEEKEMFTWSEVEQRKFLSYVLERNAYIYEVAHLVLGTGLRRGEVEALRPEHLDFENRHIVVKESFCFHSRKLKHTKSKRIRLVPMNQEIFDLMRKYQDAPPDMLIYEGFNTEKFSKKLSRWCLKAKVRRLGIHGLRHTFATSLVRAGIDVKRIQMLLGHSDVTTTMRYVHLVNGDLVGTTQCIEIGISPGAHENRPFPLTWRRKKGAKSKGRGEFAELRKKGLV